MNSNFGAILYRFSGRAIMNPQYQIRPGRDSTADCLRISMWSGPGNPAAQQRRRLKTGASGTLVSRCWVGRIKLPGFSGGIASESHVFNDVSIFRSKFDRRNQTVLHQFGLDHEKLVVRHQGRDFRLTDVHGRVVDEIVA